VPKVRLQPGSVPDPAVGAYSAPPGPLAGFKGPTSKGREGQQREGEAKGKEWGGRGKGEGKGRREGKGSYHYFFFPTSSPVKNPVLQWGLPSCKTQNLLPLTWHCTEQNAWQCLKISFTEDNTMCI